MGRGPCAAVAALLAAGPALASDGPVSAVQQAQMVQSALEVLGYYHGPLHGELDAATRAALERFVVDSFFAGAFDTLNPTLVMFVGAEAMPAVAREFGTDPTGGWDVDLSHLSPVEAEALMELHQWPSLALCGSPLAIHFQGMGYGSWLYGFISPVALRDGALVPLPDPDRPGPVEPAFTLVDQDTMQRVVGGEVETWYRCS